MAVVYTTAAKNARLDAVRVLIDGGGGAGKLEIGTAASPGATIVTVLATITFNATSAPAAASGVLTFTSNGFPKQATIGGSGTNTASSGRIRDFANTDIITGLTVGTSSADIILDSVSLTAGQTLTINSASITHA